MHCCKQNPLIAPQPFALEPTGKTMATSSLEVSIDFTRPDGQRTRPLVVEGKRLYVDEHYISVWSPVLR